MKKTRTIIALLCYLPLMSIIQYLYSLLFYYMEFNTFVIASTVIFCTIAIIYVFSE